MITPAVPACATYLREGETFAEPAESEVGTTTAWRYAAMSRTWTKLRLQSSSNRTMYPSVTARVDEVIDQEIDAHPRRCTERRRQPERDGTPQGHHFASA
jgi:hypothetical protein